MTIRHWLPVVALAVACAPAKAPSSGQNASLADVREAALRTYVQPGKLDEYYLFYSGGHSGQVYVAGVPSMRHIMTIPVFAPYPATGYGFDVESRQLLGGTAAANEDADAALHGGVS